MKLYNLFLNQFRWENYAAKIFLAVLVAGLFLVVKGIAVPVPVQAADIDQIFPQGYCYNDTGGSYTRVTYYAGSAPGRLVFSTDSAQTIILQQSANPLNGFGYESIDLPSGTGFWLRMYNFNTNAAMTNLWSVGGVGCTPLYAGAPSWKPASASTNSGVASVLPFINYGVIAQGTCSQPTYAGLNHRWINAAPGYLTTAINGGGESNYGAIATTTGHGTGGEGNGGAFTFGATVTLRLYSGTSPSGTLQARTDITMPPMDYCVKPVPKDLFMLSVSGTFATQINLTWNPVTNVNASRPGSQYQIYRGGGPPGGVLIATVSYSTTSYQDTGLTCGTAYTYYAKAVNNYGTLNSNTVNPSTSACPPGAFSITVTRNSATQNFVSWGSATGAISYDVYRNGGFLVNTGSTTNYTDNGEFCGNRYSYQVRANGSGGTVTWNSNGAVTTGAWACVPLPGAFTLTATTFSQTAIDLSWTASSNAVTYEIRRQGVLIASQPAANPRTYRNSGLTCNTSYNYVVRATNASGGTDSNSAFAVTIVCSPGAFTLTATTFSQTQNDLSWTASTNAVNYEVYRGGILISTISAVNPRTYSDTGRLCGTLYSYQIKATNASTPPTTDSNVATATTSACTPTYPGIVTLNTVTEICVNDSPAYDIAWSDTIAAPNAPATNYIIEVTKVSTGQRYTQTVSGSVFVFSWSTINQLAITPPGTTFNYSPEVSTNYSFKVTGVKTGFLNGVSGSLSDTSSASCSSCAVTPPVAFTNLAPANGSVSPYRPDFSWTTAWPSGNSGVSSYTLKVTPQGQSQLPDVSTANTFLTWAQVLAVWSGQPFLAGNDFLPVGVVYNWVVVADNQCTGVQTSASTSFTAQNLSAWLQTISGSVESGDKIDLSFARPAGSFNATGSVVSKTTNVNFDSSSGWVSINSGNTVNPDSYSSLKSLFNSRAGSVESMAALPTTGGVYKISVNQVIDSSFPVLTAPTVLIVEGDLAINSNLNLPDADKDAALILLVDDNLNVNESVIQIDAYMVVGGSFNSKSGVPSSSFSSQLNVLGGLIYYQGATFGRIIDPLLNPGDFLPAEKFTYDPRIILLFNSESILGVSRTTWQELSP